MAPQLVLVGALSVCQCPGAAELPGLLAGAPQLTSLLLTSLLPPAHMPPLQRMVFAQPALVTLNLGQCDFVGTLDISSISLQTLHASGCTNLTVCPCPSCNPRTQCIVVHHEDTCACSLHMPCGCPGACHRSSVARSMHAAGRSVCAHTNSFRM